MKVLLAEPRGFCAGVERAIEIVERALIRFGAPVYVRHEIVHNRHVVATLEAKGAVFVDEVEEIPPGAVTIFSAHGVSRRVETEAGERRLEVIDATCPLVSKVHGQGRRYVASGREVVLIGHRNHPEVQGTLGQIDGPVHIVECVDDVARLPVTRDTPLAYITQTTLSVDDTRGIIAALKGRFDDIVGPDVRDICYATQNRQRATRLLAQQADIVLVVGAANSSNSTRLMEIAREMGVPGHLIAGAEALDPAWLAGCRVVGVTAGASAPEVLVRDLLARLAELGYGEVESLEGVSENVVFKLPDKLDDRAMKGRADGQRAAQAAAGGEGIARKPVAPTLDVPTVEVTTCRSP